MRADFAVPGAAVYRPIGLLLGLLLAMSPTLANAGERSAAETRLKASFVYKFTHFVEWPADSLGPPTSSLRICTLASRVFAVQLGKIVQHRSAHGHALEVFHLEAGNKLLGCKVLFVEQSFDSQIVALGDRLRGQATLTIGESQAFLDHGGMIALLKQGRRLQFEVNRQAFQASSLLPSSQLLRLASKPGSHNGRGGL